MNNTITQKLNIIVSQDAQPTPTPTPQPTPTPDTGGTTDPIAGVPNTGTGFFEKTTTIFNHDINIFAIILASLFVVAILAVLGYFLWRRNSRKNKTMVSKSMRNKIAKHLEDKNTEEIRVDKIIRAHQIRKVATSIAALIFVPAVAGFAVYNLSPTHAAITDAVNISINNYTDWTWNIEKDADGNLKPSNELTDKQFTNEIYGEAIPGNDGFDITHTIQAESGIVIDETIEDPSTVNASETFTTSNLFTLYSAENLAVGIYEVDIIYTIEPKPSFPIIRIAPTLSLPRFTDRASVSEDITVEGENFTGASSITLTNPNYQTKTITVAADGTFSDRLSTITTAITPGDFTIHGETDNAIIADSNQINLVAETVFDGWMQHHNSQSNMLYWGGSLFSNIKVVGGRGGGSYAGDNAQITNIATVFWRMGAISEATSVPGTTNYSCNNGRQSTYAPAKIWTTSQTGPIYMKRDGDTSGCITNNPWWGNYINGLY